jgi:hypothetical protein
VETNLHLSFERLCFFHLVKPITEWQGLAPHESGDAWKIFSPADSRPRLSSLKNRFYTNPGYSAGH